MGFISVLIMGLALSMDAAAVSLAASTSGQVTDSHAGFRLAFHFGLFQALMPVLGWYIGASIEPIIADFDHWVAAALLVFVAGRMLRAAMNPAAEQRHDDPSRRWTLVLLAVATSIDALAVGLSLKMLSEPIGVPALAFGLVTFGVCQLAVLLGARVGAWLDKQAQIAGGVALIFIAVRIIITHTT